MVVALLVALAIAARLAATVLHVRAEDGAIVAQRGRAHGEMLRDLADIFRRNRATGTLELRLDSGSVTPAMSGFDEATAQQIRNVVGRFPAARMKTAPRVKRL
ncbi:MAG: DUF3634 family protein [Polyangiaceae bacterium]